MKKIKIALIVVKSIFIFFIVTFPIVIGINSYISAVDE